MNSEQVTAAAKAVGAVEDQLNALNTSVVALDNAKAAQTKQQTDATAAAAASQAAVDAATNQVTDGQQNLQQTINTAVAALTALGATVSAPPAA
ncbi:MAG: hypothetical protein KGL39_32805 [Patescibacteria group bacterium]|nr:hypothetical protein [Patescibacteria group bacterium]